MASFAVSTTTASMTLGEVIKHIIDDTVPA